jgi:serine/threonine protein kinase
MATQYAPTLGASISSTTSASINRMKTTFRSGQQFGDWTLKSLLGSGGNGEVWRCVDSNGKENAIKILKRVKAKSYSRFVDETIIIEQNSDIKGIIPLIDKFLPTNLNGEVPYYVMQLAVPSEVHLSGRSINDKIDAVLQIAETLRKLHERNIFHRDIKPANILYFNSKYFLADFGLVDYPNKKEISNWNEEIGPKWTMAPEMRRESSSADGAKADVYSLAKTLWIFLTANAKGFDGQYSTESIIDLKRIHPKIYTSPLDNLLRDSTDNDPVKRPTVDKFILSLLDWKELSKNFHSRNQEQWFEIQSKLFPAFMPSRVVWESLSDIVNVLKLVCKYDSLNHLFFPDGGGLDLIDAALATEKGCIELNFQSIHIVRPKRLLFESFEYNPEWNYFRLEADDLLPVGKDLIKKFKKNENTNIEDTNSEDELEYSYEALSELSPGEYYNYEILADKSYYQDDYFFTSFSRHVKRWNAGSFVIFGKRSLYNLISSTYDGRHNAMTTDEFRNYIRRTVIALKEKEKEKEKISQEQRDFEEGKPDTKRSFNHRIEEKTVYRCGWCGNLVAEDGSELDDEMFRYNLKVINKFGSDVVARVTGVCCIDQLRERNASR